ncbi:hypothetical protein [Citrobacter sp. CF971]|uniref:hypothetical protein n=1 Tax=Citrobacter sp. CF971 TaxID=2566012 RepID=UPI00111DF65C|nr:hypothetical protein [Citrobacter sp. CF971]QDE42281.1 hypothetical protein E6P06_02915 [Citrobacter sp. CF971]
MLMKYGAGYKVMVEMEPLSLEVLPPSHFKAFAKNAPHEIKGAVIENTERGLVIVLHVGNERRILGQYREASGFFALSMARRQCCGSMACCTGRRMQKAGFRELWKRRSGVQMDEKAKPRVAAGLGRGGTSQVALARTQRRNLYRQHPDMVCIVAPHLLPHKRKEGYGTGTATTFQPSR